MAFKLESIFGFQDRSIGPIRGVLGNLRNLDRGVGLATRSSGLLGSATARAFGTSGRMAGIATRAVGLYTTATDRARHAQERLNSQMERSRTTAAGLGTGMMGLAATGALVAGGVGLIGKGVIDQLGYIEQQRIGLTTLLKSRAAADETMKGILQFADVTPFETKEVMEAVRRGLAVGFTRGQLGPLLNTLGDAASGLSLGGSGFNELITVFGQMKSAGKLNTEDINQLTDRGIGAWQMLAKGLGKTIPEVRKMIEKGSVDSMTGIRLLMDGMNGLFQGGMKAQSATVFGLASTLSSRMTTVFAKLENSGTLKPVQGFMQNLADLTDFSKDPGKRIEQRLTTGINRVMRAIFDPLSRATGGKQGVQLVDSWLDKLDRASVWLEGNWPRIVKGAQDFWTGFTGVFKGARDTLAPVVQGAEWVAGVIGKLTGQAGGGQGVNWAWLAGAATGALLLGGALRTVNSLMLGLPASLARLSGKGLLNITKGLGGLAGRGVGALGRAATMRIPALLEIRTNPGGIFAGIRQVVTNTLGRVAPLATRLGGFFTRIGAGVLRFLPTLLRVGGTVGRVFLGLSNPIGWVVTAITLVVGTAVWAYNRFGWFRNAVNAVWNGVRVGATAAWNGIRQGVIVAAGLLVSGALAYVRLLRTGFTLAWTAIRTGSTTAWNVMRTGAATAVNFLSTLPQKAMTFGRNIMQGLTNGIRSGITGAVTAIQGAGSTILTRFKGILGIRSPSRVFAQQGGHLMEGLAIGIDRGQRRPVSSSLRAARAVMAAGALSAPALPAARAATLGAGGHSIHIQVNIPRDAVAGKSPEQAGQAIGQGIASQLADVLEQLAGQV